MRSRGSRRGLCWLLLVLLCAETASAPGLRAAPRAVSEDVPTESGRSSGSISAFDSSSVSITNTQSVSATSTATQSESRSVFASATTNALPTAATPTAAPEAYSSTGMRALAECLTVRLRVRVLAGGVLRGGARTFSASQELPPLAAQILAQSVSAWTYSDVLSAWAGKTQPFLKPDFKSNNVEAAFFLAQHEPTAATIELWAACPGWTSLAGDVGGWGGEVALGLPIPGRWPSWLLPFAGTSGVVEDGCGFVVTSLNNATVTATGFPVTWSQTLGVGAGVEALTTQVGAGVEALTTQVTSTDSVALFPPFALKPGWAYRLTPSPAQLTLRSATATECRSAGVNFGLSRSTTPPLFIAPNGITADVQVFGTNALANLSTTCVGGPLVYIRAPPSNGSIDHNITSSGVGGLAVTAPSGNVIALVANSSGWGWSDAALLSAFLPPAYVSAALFLAFAPILPPTLMYSLADVAAINFTTVSATAAALVIAAATECDNTDANAAWARSLNKIAKALEWQSSTTSQSLVMRSCSTLVGTVSASLSSASQAPTPATPRLYLRLDSKNETGAWLPRGSVLKWGNGSPDALSLAQQSLSLADTWPGVALTPSCSLNSPCGATLLIGCGSAVGTGCNVTLVALLVDEYGGVGAAASTTFGIAGASVTVAAALSTLQQAATTAACASWEPLEACVSRMSGAAAASWALLNSEEAVSSSSAATTTASGIARGVILTGLSDALGALLAREALSATMGSLAGSASGSALDAPSLGELAASLATLSGGMFEAHNNAAIRLTTVNAITVAIRSSMPLLSVAPSLPPSLFSSLLDLPPRIPAALASALAGILLQEASDVIPAWGGSAATGTATSVAVETAGRLLGALLLRGGNTLGAVAGIPLVFGGQNRTVSRCATRGSLLITSVRIPSASVGVTIDSASALPVMCNARVGDGGSARARLSAGAPGGSIASLVQWGSTGPALPGSPGPTGFVWPSSIATSSTLKPIYPPCQDPAAARVALGLPPLPSTIDVLPSRVLDTPLVSLWLSSSSGLPLVPAVAVAVSFELDVGDMGVSAAAAAAFATKPLALRILGAAAVSPVSDDASLSSALSFTPPSVTLKCPSLRGDNMTFNAAANVSLLAWSNASANDTIIVPQISAYVSQLGLTLWAAALSDSFSLIFSPLFSLRVPLTLYLAPLPMANLNAVVRLAIPCGGGGGLVGNVSAPWARAREFVCGPGAGGASINFSCPALTLSPTCPFLGTGGLWAPLERGCSAGAGRVRDSGGFSLTCECDTVAGGLLLSGGGSAIGGRWAVVDAPPTDALSGGIVATALPPTTATRRPVGESAAPVAWLSVVAITFSAAVIALFAVRADARARIRFATALAKDESVSFVIALNALTTGFPVALCGSNVVPNESRRPFHTLVPKSGGKSDTGDDSAARAAAIEWAISRPQAAALILSADMARANQSVPSPEALAVLLAITRTTEATRMAPDVLAAGWAEGTDASADGDVITDTATGGKEVWDSEALLAELDPVVAHVMRQALLPPSKEIDFDDDEEDDQGTGDANNDASSANNGDNVGDDEVDVDGDIVKENDAHKRKLVRPHHEIKPDEATRSAYAALRLLVDYGARPPPAATRSLLDNCGNPNGILAVHLAVEAVQTPNDSDSPSPRGRPKGSNGESERGRARGGSLGRASERNSTNKERGGGFLGGMSPSGDRKRGVSVGNVSERGGSSGNVSETYSERGVSLKRRLTTRRGGALPPLRRRGCLIATAAALPAGALRAWAIALVLGACGGRSGFVARCIRSAPLIATVSRERACTTPCVFNPSRPRALRLLRAAIVAVIMLAVAFAALGVSSTARASALGRVPLSGSAGAVLRAGSYEPARAAFVSALLDSTMLNATAAATLAGALSPTCSLGFMKLTQVPRWSDAAISLSTSDLRASILDVTAAAATALIVGIILAPFLALAEAALGASICAAGFPFIEAERVALSLAAGAPTSFNGGSSWLVSLVHISRGGGGGAYQKTGRASVSGRHFDNGVGLFGSRHCSFVIASRTAAAARGVVFVIFITLVAIFVLSVYALAADAATAFDAISAAAIGWLVYMLVAVPLLIAISATWVLVIEPTMWELSAAIAEEVASVAAAAAAKGGKRRPPPPPHPPFAACISARHAGLAARWLTLVIPRAAGAASNLSPERALLAIGALRDIAAALSDLTVACAGNSRLAVDWPMSSGATAAGKRRRSVRGVMFSLGTAGGEDGVLPAAAVDAVRSRVGEAARTYLWTRAVTAARAHVAAGGDLSRELKPRESISARKSISYHSSMEDVEVEEEVEVRGAGAGSTPNPHPIPILRNPSQLNAGYDSQFTASPYVTSKIHEMDRHSQGHRGGSRVTPFDENSMPPMPMDKMRRRSNSLNDMTPMCALPVAPSSPMRAFPEPFSPLPPKYAPTHMHSALSSFLRISGLSASSGSSPMQHSPPPSRTRPIMSSVPRTVGLSANSGSSPQIPSPRTSYPSLPRGIDDEVEIGGKSMLIVPRVPSQQGPQQSSPQPERHAARQPRSSSRDPNGNSQIMQNTPLDSDDEDVAASSWGNANGLRIAALREQAAAGLAKAKARKGGGAKGASPRGQRKVLENSRA